MNRRTLLERILFPFKQISTSNLSKSIQGKSILITGASYGIGEQLAILLSAYPCNLILVARTKEKLEFLKKNLENENCSITIFCGDLRNKMIMQSFLEFVGKNRVNIFVSNAGLSINRSLRKSIDRMHDFKRTMNINYHVPVEITLALIPNLKELGGHLINVSAVNVLLPPMPHWSAYQSSKVAFDQWCRSNEPELKSMGIDVSTIYFPLVKTRMIKPNLSYQNAPSMTAQQAAITIAKLMISKNKMFKPWWLRSIELLSFFFRRPMRYFISKKMTRNV